MVGLAWAIRASPNAVGEEAAPPEFTFFEVPVYSPGLQSTCVRSCLETRDRRYLRRSLAKYSAPHAGVRTAKRVAYLWSAGDSADAGIEYISPERLL
jgi:hypothetical protein